MLTTTIMHNDNLFESNRTLTSVMSTTIVLIAFLVLLVVSVDAVKILSIFPLVGRSHYTIGNTLMTELAKRGHHVTFVSPFSGEEDVENLRRIVLTGFVEEWEALLNRTDLWALPNQPIIVSMSLFGAVSSNVVEATLAHENVQKLLASDEEFDIVLVEQFRHDGLLAIASHFGVPSGLISPIGPTVWSNHLVGNPDIPSYMSAVFTEPPIHISFWRRTYYFLLHVAQKLYDHIYLYPAQNRIIQKYIPNSPHIYDIIYNASLIIYNSHVSFYQPIPTAPNMIEIGGFHVQPPKKLPDDLQMILDNAQNGVIYFSMGSLLKSKHLAPKLREEILRALSKLKETVLWKFEEDLPNLPANVIIKSWFPQQDILAHPNVKLFITHGGFQSTIESLYRGVPIIGIPIFGDQGMNVLNAVDKGHGVMLPLSKLSEDTLTQALKEVLENPKYIKNTKCGSKILQDREINPIDKAEFWIEYVVRHNGAKHLRLASLDLAWYQHASVDVILFLLAITVILFFIFYWLIRWLLGRRKAKKQKVF